MRTSPEMFKFLNKICENLIIVRKGPWLDELKDLGFILTATNVSCESIQVLIGADIMGMLLTGKRKLLSSGLVAVETINGQSFTNVIGIKDSMEKMSKHDIDLKTKEHFKETEKFNQDNRYEVCFPWADDSYPLPDNYILAKKRLEVTTETHRSRNLYDKFEKVFEEWLNEIIIEEVSSNEVA
ncbi:hypothetical protein AVEN_135872-1 [Araneus ventricosus]|uniref:Peptidase aspartic putative domain-containing protein n=1 Tax=Araneus ventricosus TaxID=182803 RepID=A0A4Y2JUR7_ARAVE|nr:hypothetical protein AVEN_71803-1 [Araneus ventricosus]GBM93603.1 hypothetical protein AVEN_135872-1 [Araneus ventricosus]